MSGFARCLLLGCSAVFLSIASQGVAQQAPVSSSGQAAGGKAEEPAVGTLHTGTKLVVVDVVVRNKSGHAVHGLKQDDFVLREAGKEQHLRSFEEYSSPAVPATFPAMLTLPPGLFTDFTPVPAHGPLNVLLIDGINTPLNDQLYLRLQLLDYTAHLAPGTRIAIFGLAPGHLYLLQGFTADPTALHSVLVSVFGHKSLLLPDGSTNQEALTDALTDPSGRPSVGPTIPMSAGSTALMTSATDTFLQQIAVGQDYQRIESTIQSFTNLGNWLLNFPGRKNVIWFSAAFPLGVDPNGSIENNTDIPGEDSAVMRTMTNLLTRAEVSVYPVDPRGVQGNGAFTADSTSLNQISVASQRNSSFYANEAAEHGAMQAVASDTGGEALYNRNNLSQATADAVENGSNYYTLSYTPSEQKTDGEWRSIRVEFAHPEQFKGDQLQYRRGYFADNLRAAEHKTGTATAIQDPNAPAAEAHPYARSAMMHGAPTPQDIPFTVRVLPASRSTELMMGAGNEGPLNDEMKPPFQRYDVDCAAAARYFNLTQTPDGHHVGSVQMAVLVYDSVGKLLNAVSRTLNFDLTPDEYVLFQRLGYREHVEISTPAKGVKFLRIGLEERTSGHVGAVEIATSQVDALAPPDYATQQSSTPGGATNTTPAKPQK